MKKTVLNFYFQLTPMEDLIKNMNSVLEQNNSHMTYFIASYLLEEHPERKKSCPILDTWLTDRESIIERGVGICGNSRV